MSDRRMQSSGSLRKLKKKVIYSGTLGVVPAKNYALREGGKIKSKGKAKVSLASFEKGFNLLKKAGPPLLL